MSSPRYTLPYKRIDPFVLDAASSSTSSHASIDPFFNSNSLSPPCSRKTPRDSDTASPKSLSSMHCDSIGSAGSTITALFSMLSATTSTTPQQPKFPVKPQHPHPRTSVAATADFLETLRSRSLLDYTFMREFSLARKKPVEERSLSKMSANSMYSMRMAQMSLEAQGQSFAGRQQWLMKSEPLQQHGETASLPSKATDELREESHWPSVAGEEANVYVKRKPMRRKRLGVMFPNPAGNVPDSQRAHERRADRGYVPQAMIRKMPAHIASNHEQPHTVTTKAAHREQRPQTSAVLVCQDLSEFDLRKCHNSSVVAQQHGFLTEQDIPKLMEETGYNRTELYALWERFQALCSISKAPKGIDKDTFHRGLPQLSVEDDFFIDRVFTILDTDSSGILEWQEFVEALSALEKGDINKRVGFLFRVYDLNGDGTIHRSEAMQFFLASLLVTANDEVEEVARHFINKIFAAVGCAHKDSMNIEDALAYMKEHPAADIYSLFGRTMVSTRQHSVVDTNSPGKLDPMAIIG